MLSKICPVAIKPTVDPMPAILTANETIENRSDGVRLSSLIESRRKGTIVMVRMATLIAEIS